MSAGCGPLASMPAARASRDRRGDALDVLAAEEAVLAGVRVEAADGDARRLEEASQRRVRELDHVEHPARLHPFDRLAQRAVRADVRDGERAAVGEGGREHHRHPLHPAQLGDHLGVTDERRVGELRRLLVHRHRHDPGDAAGEGVLRGLHDVLTRRRAGRARRARPGAWSAAASTPASTTASAPCRRAATASRPTTSSVDVEAEQLGAVGEDRRVAVHDHVVAESAGGEVAQHDLGADAGRIAHRDRHRDPFASSSAPRSANGRPARRPTSSGARTRRPS